MDRSENEGDEIDRRQLPRDIADRAIARWHEATREQSEAYRLAVGRDELEPWADLTTVAAIDAGRSLVRAILAYGPEFTLGRRHKAEKRRFSARGLRSLGKLYLAFPDPGRDEGRPGIPEDLDGPDLMMLVVVEESAIVDVEPSGYLDRPAHRST